MKMFKFVSVFSSLPIVPSLLSKMGISVMSSPAGDNKLVEEPITSRTHSGALLALKHLFNSDPENTCTLIKKKKKQQAKATPVLSSQTPHLHSRWRFHSSHKTSGGFPVPGHYTFLCKIKK
ncbi:hypothetical protein AMECASPLE_028132 [Ameca splendens]|uniref:Secreted protein n=1 Tax=Ameca splendens TaxID=208324 RepID=A0ABV0Y5A2_9TELE